MLSHQVSSDIHLKLLEPRDAAQLFGLTDSSREYLREWLPWVDGTRSVDDTSAFIEMALDQYASKRGFQAGIWHNTDLVGCIGFHAIDWTNRKTDIGYWLGQAFQGQGIMTKATAGMVNIALKEYKLNRVEIRVAAENHKSRAIPERLRFRQDGCLRQYEWLYDHFVDHVVYALLASEWKG